MSGLFLLGLIAFWLFIGWLIYLAWRLFAYKDKHTFTSKAVHAVVGLLMFSAWFGGGFWATAGKKAYYDAQVREMCAKDGGVTIYEDVELTAKQYDSYAKNNWRLPDESNLKPSDEYYYVRKRVVHREKDPTVSRRETRIVRRNDGKILGTYIRYSRGGGDLPGLWHGSHFTCPDPREVKFEKAIFKKGE